MFEKIMQATGGSHWSWMFADGPEHPNYGKVQVLSENYDYICTVKVDGEKWERVDE